MRKAQVVMALVGAFLTAGIGIVSGLAGGFGATEATRLNLYFVCFKTMYPAYLVTKLLNHPINMSQFTFPGLMLASLVNALLLSILATPAGWVWERFRKP